MTFRPIEHELECVRQRRRSDDQPDVADVVGLALSGGGIRSATVSLGVLQGLAAAKLLRSVDYLSTVSGGGYIGSFVGSIFARQPAEGRGASPSAAEDVLREDFSRRSDDYRASAEPIGWSLQWLRKSGRYLAPTGAGDYLYALALQMRNLLALHYVLGLTLVLATLAAIGVDRVLARGGEMAVRAAAIQMPTVLPGGAGLLALGVLLLALWLAPSALAYFAAETPKAGARTRPWWFTSTLLYFVLSVVACFVAARWLNGEAPSANGLTPWQRDTLAGALAAMGALLLLAIGYLLGAGHTVQRRMAREGGSAPARGIDVAFMLLGIRVELTQVLARSLTFCFAAFGAAVVLWLADQFLHHPRLHLSWPVAFTAALPALARFLLSLIPKRRKDNEAAPSSVDFLVGAAGVLAFAALVLAWATAAAWLVDRWDGSRTAIAITLVLLVWLAHATGRSFQFLNLTTIQRMYSSRISRAYLGATNPARAATGDNVWQRISDSHPNDDFSRAAYYAPHIWRYGAPVHLINVTINQTVSPTDPLVQRDRKGRPLVVSPAALGVDGRWYDWDEPARVGNQPVRLEALSIGSWIGISGAAFTTGLGRATTLGKSLLLTIANVRLGHWWKAWPEEPASVKKGILHGLGSALAAMLPTQSYLTSELFARFSGTQLTYWYLSDGGHFENTGIYELLRRRVGLIVACDNGADPKYQNQDLANLIRLARIDFACEFLQLAGADFRAAPELARFVSAIGEVGKPTRGDGSDNHCFTVFYAYRSHEPPEFERGSAIVLIKPRLTRTAPADVLAYARESPTFPQEATADQFFNESQWESYRRLGIALAGGLAPPRLDHEPADAVYFASLRDAIVGAARRKLEASGARDVPTRAPATPLAPWRRLLAFFLTQSTGGRP